MRDWELVRIRSIQAPPEVIACQWDNWDIFDAALGLRFNVERIAEGRWRLKYEGIRGDLTLLTSHWDDRQGSFHYRLRASKFLIPSAAYTIELTYAVTDPATIVTGKVTASFTGLTRLIARFVRDDVDRVLDEVLAGGEESSFMLAERSGSARSQLDERQRALLHRYDVRADHLRYKPRPLILRMTPVGGAVDIRMETPSPNRTELVHQMHTQARPPLLAEIRELQGARRRGRDAGGIPARSRRDVVEYGKQLCDEYLSAEMKIRLADAVRAPDSARFEICASDGQASAPWELLHDDRDFVCMRIPVLRRASCVSALRLEPLRELSALVVGADPDRDLPSVDDEVRWAADSLRSASARVTVIKPAEATKAEVQRALQVDDVNILHFAGHSVFDPDDSTQSHLRLADDNLYAHELGRMAADTKLSLVFLNSCESARSDSQEEGAAGLADSLLRDGVSQVVAMRWSITDDAGAALARQFYAQIADGRDIARALVSARRAAGSIDWDDFTWLAPVLYA